MCLANPGKARGCSTNNSVIHSVMHSLNNWVSHPFPLTALRRHQTQTVIDSSSSNNIDYVKVMKTFLNPEEHQIASVVPNLRTFYWRGGFWLLVALHGDGSDPGQMTCVTSAKVSLKVQRSTMLVDSAQRTNQHKLNLCKPFMDIRKMVQWWVYSEQCAMCNFQWVLCSG